MMLGRRMMRKVGGSLPSISFVGAYYDDVDRLNSYTFSGISLPAGLIVVAAMVDTSQVTAVPSMTIAGSSATMRVDASQAGVQRVAFGQRRLSSATTGDIVVNITMLGAWAASRLGIGVWAITGSLNSDTPITASNSTAGATSISATLTSAPANSVAAAAAVFQTGGYPITFTNATERFDSNRETGGTQMGGADAAISSAGNYTITAAVSLSMASVIAACAWR